MVVSPLCSKTLLYNSETARMVYRWDFLLAFNKGPSIIQHLGAPSKFLMEASLGKPSTWKSDQEFY